jgi:V8-like Glu-specific endopeptidase
MDMTDRSGIEWSSSGRRIPGYLGRVLDDAGEPAGTCFQVAPGVLVTAAHVLDDIGAGNVNARIVIDPLEGGEAFSAIAASADREHDIAAMTSQDCLQAVARALAYADMTPLRTGVSATGYAIIDDRGHQYRYLVATAEWTGPTERDEIQFGSMNAARIMPGMSGAPVVRDSDGVVIGLVSGRYNSADGWLAGNVWVARTEDLVSLLQQLPDVRVDRVLKVGEEVTTVLHVTNGSGTSSDLTSGANLNAGAGAAGIREAAWEAAKVLVALDDGAQRIGALADVALDIAVRAASTWQHSEQELRAFRRRMELRGLDPRLLVRHLAWHDGAVERWNERIPGTDSPPGTADSPTMLASFISTLIDEISGILFSQLSASCRALLRAALADEDAAPVRAFLLAVEEMLPVRRSISREVVLYQPKENGGASGDHQSAGLTYRERGLQSAALQLCRLPDADPCTRGREDRVATIVRAFSEVMAREGFASCFLSGQPGIGTSTVAVEVARQLAPVFPGGVWYVNLHGLIPGSRRDARTAVRLLAEAMTLDLGSGAMDDERMYAAFADQLAQRKTLVVLDNAADASHVERLARPPAGCGVLITSRNRLQDYASPGLAFGIGALDHVDAVEVLKIFTDEHAGDLTHLDELARLCDHVPLALRLIGARIAIRPQIELDYLVYLLSEETNRLEYLKVGERAVRAAIQLSYDNLDADAQRVLCFITAVPGSTASGKELGYSLEEPDFQQEMLLNRLEDHNLVQHKIIKAYGAGSPLAMFSPFELVRLFARERLIADISDELISIFEKKSVGYLSDSLSRIIVHADDVELSWELDPTRFHAALRIAEKRGWLELARDLAVDLHVLYLSTRELDSAREINDILVDLHLQSGEYEEAVQACLRTAESLGGRDAPEHAISFARRAREIALAHNLPLLAAEADFAASILLRKLEDLPGALDSSERAAQALIDLGHYVTAISPVLNSCKLSLEQGQGERAVSWGRRATDLADRMGSIAERADAAFNCARAEALVRNFLAAVELSRRAGALYEETGNWWNSAVAFGNGSYFSQLMGDTAHAAEMLNSEADRWERVVSEDGRAHLLECLVDLSAIQAEMSAFGQAHVSLERAGSLITRWPHSIPAAMKLEAYVRRIAVNLFLEEDSHSDGDKKAAVSIPQAHDGDSAEQTPEPDAELERVQTVVCRVTDGTLTNAEARRLVVDFMATPARHRAEKAQFWLHEGADFSLKSRTALSTGPETKGSSLPALGEDTE